MRTSLNIAGRWIVQVFGFEFVNTEAPIDVAPEDPTNEPEPDLIGLTEDVSPFTSNPRPEDLRLVVGIADVRPCAEVTVDDEHEQVSPPAAPQASFRVADASPARHEFL